MKIFKMLLVMCCCAAMASSAAAVITGDAGGNFNIVGEASDFVNWASTNHSVSVESGQTMMQTILDVGKGYHYTTSPTTSNQSDLDILFTFAKPLVTCRLDYGSVIDMDQSLAGGPLVQLEITAKAVKTLIYLHDHFHAGVDYNYTPVGGVPTGERERVYTIIDDLVAGETEFTLNIATVFGSDGDPNAGTLLHYGGSFLPDREEATPIPLWPESDFILSGTMDLSNSDDCSEIYTQSLAGDISGPSGVPDCHVDLYDLALMSQLWLECTDPQNLDCIQ